MVNLQLHSLNAIKKHSNWSRNICLQQNRLVQSPFWMDSKVPSIGLVWLSEHGTFVNGSITGYFVNRKMVPCLELLPDMNWEPLSNFLVIWLFGNVWNSLRIVQQLTTRCNGAFSSQCLKSFLNSSTVTDLTVSLCVIRIDLRAQWVHLVCLNSRQSTEKFQGQFALCQPNEKPTESFCIKVIISMLCMFYYYSVKLV